MTFNKPIFPFTPFPKMPRLSREITITEKLDGTNASIVITEEGEFYTGSRNRWITPDDDNYGFSKWAHENKETLMLLGPGQHFGEWWGNGIQRRYNMPNKVFSLFNTGRWEFLNGLTADQNPLAGVCRVVPVLYQGEFYLDSVNSALENLKISGSIAAPGFMNPEGIVVYHSAAKTYFKKLIEQDHLPKGLIEK